MLPVDELYFSWLRDQSVVLSDQHCYNRVLEVLYRNPYEPLHPMDTNREADGLELRDEWVELYSEHVDIQDYWYAEPCSILEMLVAFSRRCNFQTSSLSAEEWVVKFLNNLNIHISDFNFEGEKSKVYETIIAFNEGEVSIFPDIQENHNEQLWYQMMEYIELNELTSFM